MAFYCRFGLERDIRHFAWLFYLCVRDLRAVFLCGLCSGDVACRGCQNEGVSSLHSCHLVWGAELLEVLGCAPWLPWLFPSPVVTACPPQDLKISISPTWIQMKKMTPVAVNMVWVRKMKWGTNMCCSVRRHCHLHSSSYLFQNEGLLPGVSTWYLWFLVKQDI